MKKISKSISNFFSEETKDPENLKNDNTNLQPVQGPMIIKETTLSNKYNFKIVHSGAEFLNNKEW